MNKQIKPLTLQEVSDFLKVTGCGYDDAISQLPQWMRENSEWSAAYVRQSILAGEATNPDVFKYVLYLGLLADGRIVCWDSADWLRASLIRHGTDSVLSIRDNAGGLFVRPIFQTFRLQPLE